MAILSDLIRRDPAQALRNAFSPEEASSLVAAVPGISDDIETFGHWDGIAEVLIQDDFRGGTSQTFARLSTGSGLLEVYFTAFPPSLTSRQQVSIRGMRLGNLVAASAASVGPSADNTSCSPVGVQETAILTINAGGKTIPDLATPSYIRSLVFGSGPWSLSDYVREGSYGRATVTGDAFGPFTIATPFTELGTQTQAALEAFAAADAVVDFRQYGRIIFIVPVTPREWSTLGCVTMHSQSKGDFTASVAVVSHWGYTDPLQEAEYQSQVISHEFGHSLGLLHAHGLLSGVVAVGPTVGPDDIEEYGNQIAAMGSSLGYNRDLFLGHYDAPHKAQLGWLDAGTGWMTAASSGTYTIQPLEASSGLRALRVPRGKNSDASLWLEYRQPLGYYDRTFQALSGYLFLNSSGAAAINAFYSGPLVNYQSSPDALDNTVLNFNPSKANNDVLLYQFYAPIVPGQTWKDPYSELTLSVNKSSAGGVEVSVSFDDLCATITPTTNWFMPLKSAGTIHVTAPSGCSWSAASNVPWISLTSGASGNGAGDVSYTVLPNSGTDYRVGSITIQRRTFAMMQAGTTTVSYPLARPGSLSFTATAGGVAPARQNLKLTATAWPLQLALQPGQPWISLSSTTASTPAAVSVGVVTTGLAAGHYDGWIVAISGSLSWELDVTLDVLEPPGPYFVSAGIVNAASYVPGLIPGSLATLFGKRLSGISGIASAGGATTYSGVTVTVGGVRAPLLNLVNLNGQEQISFQTPFELPAGVTTVELQNGNSRFSLPGVPVSAIGPGLFELSLNGRRQGAVVHQDGSLVTPANPARRGEVVSLYFTGGGPLIPPVPTGALGPVPPPIAASDVLVGVGGSICRVLFAGYAPQALGLYQVNFEIADNIPSGPAQSLQLSSSAVPSQQSTIAIE